MTWKKTYNFSKAINYLLMVFIAGCTNSVKPNSLKPPEIVTCIQVPSGIVSHDERGLLNIKWTTRLQAGPYIAELEDAEGIYYRAPAGGIYMVMDDLADKPHVEFNPKNHDGGIWVSRNSAITPRVYIYNSTDEATVIPAPEDANCNKAVFVRDPVSKGVSVVEFGAGGAVGGAIGGVIGHSVTNNSSISYGQAAGVGVASGAIAGVIIATIINMDIGKIFIQPSSTNAAFIKELDNLAKAAVPIKESSKLSVESK